MHFQYGSVAAAAQSDMLPALHPCVICSNVTVADTSMFCVTAACVRPWHAFVSPAPAPSGNLSKPASSSCVFVYTHLPSTKLNHISCRQLTTVKAARATSSKTGETSPAAQVSISCQTIGLMFPALLLLCRLQGSTMQQPSTAPGGEKIFIILGA
jgi:hypothetical protein